MVLTPSLLSYLMTFPECYFVSICFEWKYKTDYKIALKHNEFVNFSQWWIKSWLNNNFFTGIVSHLSIDSSWNDIQFI